MAKEKRPLLVAEDEYPFEPIEIKNISALSIDSALVGQAGAIKLMTAIVKLKEDIVKKYEDKRAVLEASYNAELELVESLREIIELNK